MLRHLGVPEVVVTALSVVLPIWAWWAYVVPEQQDIGAFTSMAGLTLGVGALAHLALFFWVRPAGSLRARAGLSGLDRSAPDVYLLGYLAPVVVGVVIAVGTPGSTSLAWFDRDLHRWQVYLLLTLAGIIAATLAGVVFWVVLLPLSLLVFVLLPRRPGPDTPETAGVMVGVSRGEVATFALTILATVGFGLCLGTTPGSSSGTASRTASGTASSSTRGTMAEQLRAVLGGDAGAGRTLLAIALLLVIVGLQLLHHRLRRRRTGVDVSAA